VDVGANQAATTARSARARHAGPARERFTTIGRQLERAVVEQQETDFCRQEAERCDRFGTVRFGDVENALEHLAAVFGNPRHAPAAAADHDGRAGECLHPLQVGRGACGQTAERRPCVRRRQCRPAQADRVADAARERDRAECAALRGGIAPRPPRLGDVYVRRTGGREHRERDDRRQRDEGSGDAPARDGQLFGDRSHVCSPLKRLELVPRRPPLTRPPE
jgi:hypothetical protein